MSDKDALKIIRRFHKTTRTGRVRSEYLRAFTPKMIYRTTKTENGETTMRMVLDVLGKKK
jgi:hypothetical protein